MDLIVWFTPFLALVVFLYWYYSRAYNYWAERGIPSAKTLLCFGSQFDILKHDFHEIENERYKTLGRIYGHYEGWKPALSIGDPVLLKNILVKDFPVFPNRRVFRIGDEVIDKMVSVLENEDWKRVRTLITPAFTSGKIRKMASIILDSADTICQNFAKSAKAGESVDAKRFFGAFTMDVIASAAFATKVDSHNDPDNKFVSLARKAFTAQKSVGVILLFLIPKLLKIYQLFFRNEVVDFFKNATLQIIEERKKTGQSRNDFLQLMMEAAGEIESSSRSNEKEDKDDENETLQYKGSDSQKGLSRNELVAQCVLFFLAGYDTTGSTLSFVTYLLALHPEIQERLIKEIDSTLSNHKGDLTYEAVQSMKYLDSVISETLRMYPPAVRIERQPVEDYDLGYGNLTIPKGMTVGVPVYAMHHDPEFYPDPEKFDPDRFSPEAKAERNPYTYLPFGAGPRNCLGMRFAMMEIKICLVRIFSQFRLKRCSETKVPLEFSPGPGTGLLQPKGIILNVEERTDKVQ